MRALRSKKAADNGCRMRIAGPGVRLRKGSDEAAATIRQLAMIDHDRLSGIGALLALVLGRAVRGN
jgi:hypothetical protein